MDALDRFRTLVLRSLRAPPAKREACVADGDVAFQCNLCGAHNRVPDGQIHREVPSCASCRSTVRFRSLGHLVVREVLGKEAPFPSVGRHPGIRGIGLSDAQAYALPLAGCFDYTNTFFHAEPRLDIVDVPDSLAGRFDFVIASEVFEHVAPPVARAFTGARKLLRDGGVLILTVPFKPDGDTVEHFPELFDFRLEGTGDGTTLVNTTRDGREQRFEKLVFHGGPGMTLEMREFSRDGLLRELAAAGFSDVKFCGEPCERFGIVWPEPWSMPIVARA